MNPRETALIRRYLIWCYKTTKEELDTTDRKFTQLKVDYRILRRLLRIGNRRIRTNQKTYRKAIDDFRQYIAAKEKDANRQKYLNQKQDRFNARYLFLQNRLESIEGAIRFFLGSKELRRIQLLYEQEMIRRILEEREHR